MSYAEVKVFDVVGMVSSVVKIMVLVREVCGSIPGFGQINHSVAYGSHHFHVFS